MAFDLAMIAFCLFLFLLSCYALYFGSLKRNTKIEKEEIEEMKFNEKKLKFIKKGIFSDEFQVKKC